MTLFNKDAKERFEQEMEAGPPVAAEEIQASVGGEGKGGGLGSQTKATADLRSFGPTQGALDKQSELKYQREASQQAQQKESVVDIVSFVMISWEL